jgi:GDP-L-fucose synthase
MKFKRTLVTGAHGLVGSTIEADFRPTSKELDLMKIDDIKKYLNSNQIDSIIHCAAKVGGIGANINNAGDFFYGNIMMNTNLLEAARTCGVNKVVSFMSTCVFPAQASYPLTSEQIHNGEPHDTNYPYAYAKRMLDVMGRAYKKQYGTNFITVIPCNAYGPNDNYNLESSHAIPAIIHKCYLAKKNGTDLELWGTGRPHREFVFSKDLGFLARWVLENYDDLEPLVLSVDKEENMHDIAKLICQHMDFTGKIIYNQQMEGQLRKPSDNSKLRQLVPEFEFTPLEDGIQETVEWFLKNYEVCRK